jgi:hypothetical protein
MRALSFIFVFLGCAHITLQPVSASAPLEERQAAYEKQKSKDQGIRQLTLSDGSQVYHIEDLLTVLPPESKITKAAKKSQKFFIPGMITAGATLALSVTTVSLFAAGGAKLKEGSDADNEVIIDEGIKKMLIGVGFGVALFPAGLATNYYFGGWRQSRAATFEGYNKTLKRQMNLCEEGGALGECSGVQ